APANQIIELPVPRPGIVQHRPFHRQAGGQRSGCEQRGVLSGGKFWFWVHINDEKPGLPIQHFGGASPKTYAMVGAVSYVFTPFEEAERGGDFSETRDGAVPGSCSAYRLSQNRTSSRVRFVNPQR